LRVYDLSSLISIRRKVTHCCLTLWQNAGHRHRHQSGPQGTQTYNVSATFSYVCEARESETSRPHEVVQSRGEHRREHFGANVLPSFTKTHGWRWYKVDRRAKPIRDERKRIVDPSMIQYPALRNSDTALEMNKRALVSRRGHSQPNNCHLSPCYWTHRSVTCCTFLGVCVEKSQCGERLKLRPCAPLEEYFLFQLQEQHERLTMASARGIRMQRGVSHQALLSDPAITSNHPYHCHFG
jgi:hypothetical protein